jgi:GNAT superfamily N-acetyltransferase
VTITIELQTRLDSEAETRFAEIYEASFPPSERDETADLIASIAAGERLCFLARIDGVVVGLAVVFRLSGPSVAFLEYLAVAPSERNAGIGSSMFAHLETHLSAGGEDAVGVLLEVDPPEEADGAERVLRERRVDFYNFTLIWLPLAGAAPTQLAGSFLRRCVEAVLTQSYALSRDDPLVREVVNELAC